MNTTIVFNLVGAAICGIFLGWRGALGFILGGLVIAALRNR